MSHAVRFSTGVVFHLFHSLSCGDPRAPSTELGTMLWSSVVERWMRKQREDLNRFAKH